jgi:hypothetical protein
MLAGYVDTTPITYVLETLPQSAQIVKPAMLESSGMKLLKSWEKKEDEGEEHQEKQATQGF